MKLMLNIDTLKDLPANSIIIDETGLVIALKLTPTLWTVTGEKHVVLTDNLVRYADDWNLIRDGKEM